MGGWTQTILAGLVTAAFLAGGTAVVTVAVVSSKANANEEKIVVAQERIRAVEKASIEVKTDVRWVKEALRELLRERGLPAPGE